MQHHIFYDPVRVDSVFGSLAVYGYTRQAGEQVCWHPVSSVAECGVGTCQSGEDVATFVGCGDLLGQIEDVSRCVQSVVVVETERGAVERLGSARLARSVTRVLQADRDCALVARAHFAGLLSGLDMVDDTLGDGDIDALFATMPPEKREELRRTFDLVSALTSEEGDQEEAAQWEAGLGSLDLAMDARVNPGLFEALLETNPDVLCGAGVTGIAEMVRVTHEAVPMAVGGILLLGVTTTHRGLAAPLARRLAQKSVSDGLHGVGLVAWSAPEHGAGAMEARVFSLGITVDAHEVVQAMGCRGRVCGMLGVTVIPDGGACLDDWTREGAQVHTKQNLRHLLSTLEKDGVIEGGWTVDPPRMQLARDDESNRSLFVGGGRGGRGLGSPRKARASGKRKQLLQLHEAVLSAAGRLVPSDPGTLITDLLDATHGTQSVRARNPAYCEEAVIHAFVDASQLFPYQRASARAMGAMEASAGDDVPAHERLFSLWEPLAVATEPALWIHATSGHLAETPPARPATLVDPIPAPRCNILCERVGTGKTLMTLALLVAMRGEMAVPPPSAAPTETLAMYRSRHLSGHQGEPGGRGTRVPSLQFLVQSAIRYGGKVRFAGPEAPEAVHRRLHQEFGAPVVSVPLHAARVNARRSQSLASRTLHVSHATLLVLPSAILEQWYGEARRHLRPGMLSFLWLNEWQPGQVSPEDVCVHDVVVVTIDQVAAFAETLNAVCWRRVVCDEGHVLGRGRTAQRELLSHLCTNTLWAITGTPSVGKGGLCLLGHIFGLTGGTDGADYFSGAIQQPLRRGAVAVAAKRLARILHDVAVRTPDAIIQAQVNIPPLHEHTVQMDMFPGQRVAYNEIVCMARTNIICSQGVGVDSLMERQNAHAAATVIANLLQATFFMAHVDESQKGICRMEIVAHLLAEGRLDGDHWRTTCEDLLQRYDPQSTIQGKLAECRAKRLPKCDLDELEEMLPWINVSAAGNEHLQASNILTLDRTADESGRIFTKSAKLTHIMNKIAWIVQELGQQVIVFSQSNETLAYIIDTIAWANAKDGPWHTKPVSTVGYHMLVPKVKRYDALIAFNQGTARVIVMNARLAAEGINLTAAQHVIFAEHVSNAQRREQAIARAHRIGQKHSVYVEHCVSKGCLEPWLHECDTIKAALLRLRLANWAHPSSLPSSLPAPAAASRGPVPIAPASSTGALKRHRDPSIINNQSQKERPKKRGRFLRASQDDQDDDDDDEPRGDEQGNDKTTDKGRRGTEDAGERKRARTESQDCATTTKRVRFLDDE